MVDEILLDTFQTELFATYDAIIGSDLDARGKLEAVVRASFDAIDQHHAEVAIFQNDAAYLMDLRAVRLPARAQRPASAALWLDLLWRRIEAGALRADLDVELVYRFMRDTVWVAVRWYRPGGELPAQKVADQYLSILLDGIASCEGVPRWLRPTSSTPSAPRSASAAGRSPRCTPPTSARTCCRALMERTGVDPAAVDDVVMGCCDTIGSQAGDVARTAWLVAGLPDHVPGVTIDRQCGSSQQAVHFAAQGVMSGTQDLVVAGGLQNMSAIPISAAMLVGRAVRLLHPVRRVARLGAPGTATRRSPSSAPPR